LCLSWFRLRARAHLAGRDDGLVQARPLLDQAPDWAVFLAGGLSDDEREALRAGERTGRPLGSAAFIAGLEQSLARPVARRKPGPKPAGAAR
jgi:putative transposase